MGIKGLTKLINDQVPGAIKHVKIETYLGRRVAFDASMHIYQFMAVVGRAGDQLLTNEAGDVTSHIQGLFNRTIRIVECGIKPVFVFDGKPPDLKKAEIEERKEKREEADKALAAAKEEGDEAEVEKMSKRTIRVTKVHNEECKLLLKLMGIPIIEAPSEAEAQCAELCKKGKVYAVGSEDMDTLTFGSRRLSRHLMEPPSNQKDIMEFDLDLVLEGLDMSMEQFVDLCILCGCDYCDSVKGVGPTTALKLIREHGSLENVVSAFSASESKYSFPSNFPYKESRQFFLKPEVIDGDTCGDFKSSSVDEDGLIKFLVTDRNFSEERVRKGISKLKKASKSGTQKRMESFFKPAVSSFAPLKRKQENNTKISATSKKTKGLVTKGKSKGVGKR